jgi:hypothetical protein
MREALSTCNEGGTQRQSACTRLVEARMLAHESDGVRAIAKVHDGAWLLIHTGTERRTSPHAS